MYMQQTRGPKSIIPRGMRPRQYEYIRKFRSVDDLEANRVSQEDNSGANEGNFNRAEEPSPFDDCAICMHNLRFEVDD